MIQYRTIIVSGSDAENLADALAGLGEKKRRVRALWFEGPKSASGSTQFVRGRAYKQRNQVVDFNMDVWLQSDQDANPLNKLALEPRVPIDVMLERGDGFEVGFFLSSGTPTGRVTMEFEDLE